MSQSAVKALLRWHWHLLPQSFRTLLVFRYDMAYLKFHHLNDWRYDRRLNIATRWERPFGDSEANATELGDPVMTQSTPYAYLRRLRNYLKLGREDSLLDIGCGAGRVVIYMAEEMPGRCRGIDFDAIAYKAAQDNLARTRVDRSRISFVQGDAARASMDDVTVIFMGNPFGAVTMARVLENIEKSLRRNPRPLRICYYNPVQGALLDEAKWLSRIHVIPSQKKPIVIYQHDPETGQSDTATGGDG